MCRTCAPEAGFIIAASGFTSTTRPSTRRKPAGVFIHALAVTTNIPEHAPLTATMTPAKRWAARLARVHPYRYTPRKIASRKKANPSSENGMPMTPPASSIKRGHSRPSSKREHRARDGANGEEDGRAPRPALGEIQIDLPAGAQPEAFGDHHHHGHGHADHREHDVERERQAHLPSGRDQVRHFAATYSRLLRTRRPGFATVTFSVWGVPSSGCADSKPITYCALKSSAI